ncbi:hypothetical protein KIN20_036953 [Parelaphostrongylus tenuis]|uniref:Uncharacterized protein n=1 Tax=Parelaphostrongylus tenuis TaxID=148309 RepID=A0AAD5RH84_PARTN|nr:hypothetical protein KIN20_008756 [Parelaphostrongylus tenuis]KAJ1374294.1 hypothetical protein KIN20_036953 [Parelaphostrongylus tenuis]
MFGIVSLCSDGCIEATNCLEPQSIRITDSTAFGVSKSLKIESAFDCKRNITPLASICQQQVDEECN